MIFWRMLVTKQFLLPNDFRSIFFSPMATSICLVTYILQNIFFYVKQKLIQVLSNLRVSKWWQNFYFWVNYTFIAICHPRVCGVYSYMMRGISGIKPGLCLITQTGISNAWLQSLMQRALSSVMGFSLLQLRWILLSYAILPMKAMNRLSLVKMEEIMDRANTLVQCSYYSKKEMSVVFKMLNMVWS